MPTFRVELASGVGADAVLEILTDNGMGFCPHCDGLCVDDDTREVRTGSGRYDMESWCESCADDDTRTCDGCGELCADDCIHGDDNGTYICDRCAENGYTTCSSCNCWVNTDCGDYVSTDDGIYCSNGCAPEEEEEEEEEEEVDDVRALQDSTMRAPRGDLASGRVSYHGDTIRSRWTIPSGSYSMEIECCGTTTGDELNSCADVLRNAHNCACESDGSLDSVKGMEVITEPRTIDAQLESLPKILQVLRNFQFRAWDKGEGYGIHVNVDARSWNVDKIAAYCNLFHTSLRPQWEKIAGRSENSWSRYKRSEDSKIPTDKYEACALKSGGRLEVRVFRSTLKESTALGYLAICHDLARYCDYDLSARPAGLFAWLKQNASPQTRALLVEKLGAEYTKPENVLAD